MTEYRAADFPHGLRCADCEREFVEGQPIAECPDSSMIFEGEPTLMLILKCRDCAANPREAENE